jgi:hypothetical protein
MWYYSVLDVRFRSTQTVAHMSDVVVDEDEWLKLEHEVYIISKDMAKVSTFMEQHVNKKWAV